MKRLVLISYILTALILLPGIPPTSAEEVNPDNQPQTEKSKVEEKSNLFSECQRVQGELWKDYQKLRDELMNGYLSAKLWMKYEEFKLKHQELMGKYLEEQYLMPSVHQMEIEGENGG